MSFFRRSPSSGAPERAGRDLLLTGLLRSGTTLTCHLLNKVDDVVALHEPMDISRFFGAPDAERVRHLVAKFCAKTRESVRTRGVAPSKQVGGKVPENPVADDRDAQGERRRITSKGEVAIDRPMGPDFTLIVKHPGLFTAFLEELVAGYAVFALVRNPLSVLCSWNTIPFHIRDGRVPATERVAPELAAALDSIGDATSRQLHILNWFLGRYVLLIEPSRILRYEEVIATRGRALAAVVPAARSLDEPLASRNKSELYPRDLMRRLAARLRDDEGAWRRFYDDAAVAELLE